MKFTIESLTGSKIEMLNLLKKEAKANEFRILLNDKFLNLS
jgi:hypothetical protein